MTLMRHIETADLALEPQLAMHAEAMFVVLSDPAIYGTRMHRLHRSNGCVRVMKSLKHGARRMVSSNG